MPPSVEELNGALEAYDVLEILGRGGMGAVYKARQASLDRLVAIKILPKFDDEAGVAFAERFQREARALAKLSHPNIVGVYDFGETRDGYLYIVMEYVDGTDLFQLIRTGELGLEHFYGWIPQLCDALEYAHSRGVVHRDVKPANILISREGELKVADFGLAKLSGVPGESMPALTVTNVSMGTPDYAAPESWESAGDVDHRADLYAVGVMMYEMLTGKVPRGAWKPPSVLDPSLDPRLDELISRAMDSDPDSRIQSASEIRTAVVDIHQTPDRGAISGERARRLLTGPVAVSAESEVATVRQGRKNTGLVLGLLGGLAVTVAAVGAVMVFGPDREPADDFVHVEGAAREDETPDGVEAPAEESVASADSQGSGTVGKTEPENEVSGPEEPVEIAGVEPSSDLPGETSVPRPREPGDFHSAMPPGGGERPGLPLHPDPGPPMPRPVLPEGFVHLTGLIDLERDGRHGEWEGGAGDRWVATGEDVSVLEIPAVLPGSYDFHVMVQSEAGRGPVYVAFPVGRSRGLLVLGGEAEGGGRLGLELLDGEGFEDNGTAVEGQWLRDGRPHAIGIYVRLARGGHANVRAFVDGLDLLHWQGDSARLELPDPWSELRPSRVAVGSGAGAPVAFSSFGWREAPRGPGMREMDDGKPGRPMDERLTPAPVQRLFTELWEEMEGELREAALDEFERGVSDLNAKYVKALQGVRAKYEEGAIANLDEEIARIEAGDGPGDFEPSHFAQHRRVYLEELAKLEETRDRAAEQVFLTSLERLREETRVFRGQREQWFLREARQRLAERFEEFGLDGRAGQGQPR